MTDQLGTAPCTPPVRKNEHYTAAITGMTAEGNGVARVNGFTVFVPGTALGDTVAIKIVKVLKHYGFGIVESIVTASPDRIDNDCAVYKQCGGCCFRHLSYEAELRLKQQLVEDSFRRLGSIDLSPQPIVGSERTEGYRNKAQFPIGLDASGNAIAGFFAKRSHRIVSCSSCKLQPPIFHEIVWTVLSWIDRHHVPVYNEETHKGGIRHLYLRQAEATGEIMLCLVSAHKSLPCLSDLIQAVTESFPQVKSIVLNYNSKPGNVILGSSCRTLFGSDTITDILCGVHVQISPLSFYQVNKRQAERLYEQAIAYADLNERDTLLDLYCGIGTIGLSAAERVGTLIGVEIVPQAVENAQKNAQLNGLKHARFLCDDCKGAVRQLETEGIQPNVILVDPPRKGCDADVIETIVRLAPDRVVMVSCNPATAARDCKLLEERGYRVMEYRPFDLFPRTGHVETVCLLSKLHANQHIEVELQMDELDLTAAESKATYEEIKEYVLKQSGLKVSNLYIAQVKQKCGIIERENYNLPKSENSRQPKSPPEKEAAIREALEHFRMI